jgi:hypothetical protein
MCYAPEGHKLITKFCLIKNRILYVTKTVECYGDLIYRLVLVKTAVQVPNQQVNTLHTA